MLYGCNVDISDMPVSNPLPRLVLKDRHTSIISAIWLRIHLCLTKDKKKGRNQQAEITLICCVQYIIRVLTSVKNLHLEQDVNTQLT